jgi:hypothetical protein
LLELYQEHLTRGGDPGDVPVWARRELESFANPNQIRTEPVN